MHRPGLDADGFIARKRDEGDLASSRIPSYMNRRPAAGPPPG